MPSTTNVCLGGMNINIRSPHSKNLFFLQGHNKYLFFVTSTHFSQKITVFHGPPPEPGFLAGYAAVIEALRLPVPIPQKLALISTKNRKYEQDGWMVFTLKHHPGSALLITYRGPFNFVH